MKTLSEYLEQDGNLAFNVALFNRFSSIGDNSYAEICGGFYNGVYQWADHNIDYVEKVKNDKFTGWKVHFNEGIEKLVYVPNWVMSLNVNDWKHALNVFNKYFKEKNTQVHA